MMMQSQQDLIETSIIQSQNLIQSQQDLISALNIIDKWFPLVIAGVGLIIMFALVKRVRG